MPKPSILSFFTQNDNEPKIVALFGDVENVKTAYIKLVSELNAVLTDVTTRGPIIAYAFAFFAARAAVFPTGELHTAGGEGTTALAFYELNVRAKVEEMANTFNEEVVFDYQLALRLARNFWMIRYQASNPKSEFPFSSDLGFFENIFGIGVYLSEDEVKFLNTHQQNIFLISRYVGQIMEHSERG